MTNVKATIIHYEGRYCHYRGSSQHCWKEIHVKERKELLEQGRKKQTRTAQLTGNNLASASMSTASARIIIEAWRSEHCRKKGKEELEGEPWHWNGQSRLPGVDGVPRSRCPPMGTTRLVIGDEIRRRKPSNTSEIQIRTSQFESQQWSDECASTLKSTANSRDIDVGGHRMGEWLNWPNEHNVEIVRVR